jgi:copper chaperone CopZ
MKRTILAVQGMSCSSCVGRVAAALTIEGVQHVEVQTSQGTVTIDHQPTVAVGRLVAALEVAGYLATLTP